MARRERLDFYHGKELLTMVPVIAFGDAMAITLPGVWRHVMPDPLDMRVIVTQIANGEINVRPPTADEWESFEKATGVRGKGAEEADDAENAAHA